MRFVAHTSNLAANEDKVLGTINPGLADKVVGLVKASHAGTLHVEQSTDGTNWDLDTTVAVTADVGVSFDIAVYGSTVRLRYTNGPAGTTYFRLRAKTSSAGPR